MEDQENPLIKALPPETDYFTYLTIIEYHLSLENLPVLHGILQDDTLTAAIGWDLVHLLVPFLPESLQCLRDIARLGNPREVILKVTESLRLIEYEDDEAEAEERAAEPGAAPPTLDAESSTYPLKTAVTVDGTAVASQAVELPPPMPLVANQFIALLSMLSVLHRRVKTKHPSRFLSTTLQAILASFSKSVVYREEMIVAIVQLVKSVAGTKRPPLPGRRSSSMLSSVQTKPQADISTGNDEAPADTSVSSEEKAMQMRLLQSFVTHVMEEYMVNLASESDDVPGMAWCSRIMEKLHPERIIPETKTFASRFADEENLHHRIDAVGQLVAVAQDLNLATEELLKAATTSARGQSNDVADDDEPPATAGDIPLSRLGSLLVYTARQVSNILYGASRPTIATPFSIFPDHQGLLQSCLSSPDEGTGTLGTEPEAIIDAVVALGLVTLERDAVGEPASDEQFSEYLQITALLSSNCPSGNLRGHAHYLTSTILRSQPDEEVRLAFIRDTLEHCPFENLKVSAVGWIKGETIEANPSTSLAAQGEAAPAGSSLFARPVALDSLAPFLFPSLKADIVTAPLREAWLTFRTNFSFYLASLNLLYLLLCAKHLHDSLAVQDLWINNDIAGSFLQPLRDASEMFKKGLEAEGVIAEEKSNETLAEVNVLDGTLEKVTAAVRHLND